MSGRSSIGFVLAGACALLPACGEGVGSATGDVAPGTGALTLRVPPNGPVLQLATNPAFMVRSLGGRCLDFGAAPLVSGRPVVLRDCNRGASQQVVVQDVNARHDVVLHAGDKVLGVYVPDGNAPASSARMAGATPAAGAATVATASDSTSALVSRAAALLNGAAQFTIAVDSPPPPLAPGEVALVLQDPVTVVANGNVQVFSFDGDTLMLAGDRERVVKVADGRNTRGTPLVVGPRELADGELWDLVALDGTGRRPTSAFVHATEGNLAQLLGGSGPGTVIEVDPGDSLEVHLEGHPIFVAPGITLRGGRRGLVAGGEIFTRAAAPGGILDVRFPDVRITGLRLRGPSADIDPCGVRASGIGATAEARNPIVDRCELSRWTDAAVMATENHPELINCGLDVARPMNVRVIRNYIHDNARQSGGYGVATNAGGNALVSGNTFLGNRHAIKAGGEPHTQYRAWYNLVLSYAPRQLARIPDTCVATPVPWFTQDFDVHGMNDNGMGGPAGQYFDIARNTFLATNRQNFDLRGISCRPVDFRDNVSLQPLGDAIATCDGCAGGTGGGTVNVWGTAQFERANPARRRLGTGDFDGDGRQDLFLATGAAWYYSAAGATEWRLLNTSVAGIADLRFGDFDADGRTDVFSVRGSDWVVSWGGVSGWDVINSAGAPLDHLAVGDFAGDARADVFYADEHEWWLSAGGRGPLVDVNTSSYHGADLRFGDFDGDGKTDVFALANGDASFSSGASSAWQPLWSGWASHLDIADTEVADFDGDGRADLIFARLQSVGSEQRWDYYVVRTGGDGSGSTLHSTVPLSAVPAIGAFDANPGADVLLWNPDAVADPATGIGPPDHLQPLEAYQWLLISSAGTAGWQRYSPATMR